MRIAKPLLLIVTPLGVALGLYEAWHLAGGLVFIMAALLGVMGVALGSIIMTIRREQAEQAARERESAAKTTDSAADS
jgi:hypothetical protein